MKNAWLKAALTGGVLMSMAVGASGCMSQQEIAAAKAAQLASDKQECTSMGFSEGTDAFGNCLLKLREIRAKHAEAAAINNAAMSTPMWGDPWYPFARPFW